MGLLHCDEKLFESIIRQTGMNHSLNFANMSPTFTQKMHFRKNTTGRWV